MLYELAEYRASNRNRLIRPENIQALVRERGLGRPLFRSIFWYTEDIRNYLKVNKSVASYRGVRGISEVVIDVDKGNNSNEYTLSKLREYMAKLADLGVNEDSYQIYFSGTGYHIFITNDVFGFEPSIELPKIVGITLHNIDLLADPVASRGSQLIRIEHSINEKSGLYKIPLTYDEALNASSDAILTMAKEQRLDFPYPELIGKLELEKYILAPSEPEVAEKAYQKEGKFNSLYAVCIQSLWNNGPVEGERNNSLLRMASHFKRQGIPEEATMFSLLGWNNKGRQSLDPKIVTGKVKTVYNSPYRYGCNDTLLKKYCSKNCIFYKHKNLSEETLMNASDMDKALEERIWMIQNKDLFINLKETFGLDDDCVLYPGEFVVFQGDTGTNKTSIIQNIMLGVDMVNDLVKPPGIPIIYYGPELHAGEIQLRNYCIVTGYNKERIVAHKEDVFRYREALEHISVQQGILTLAGIEKLITENQPKVLVIDYFEQVEHPSWDRSPSIAVAEIAKALSAMAVKYNIIIIAISQVNRDSAKSKEIGIHSGFGSGAIEKTARRLFVINGEQNSPYRTISQVKANSDMLFKDIVIERQDNWRFKRIK